MVWSELARSSCRWSHRVRTQVNSPCSLPLHLSLRDPSRSLSATRLALSSRPISLSLRDRSRSLFATRLVLSTRPVSLSLRDPSRSLYATRSLSLCDPSRSLPQLFSITPCSYIHRNGLRYGPRCGPRSPAPCYEAEGAAGGPRTQAQEYHKDVLAEAERIRRTYTHINILKALSLSPHCRNGAKGDNTAMAILSPKTNSFVSWRQR